MKLIMVITLIIFYLMSLMIMILYLYGNYQLMVPTLNKIFIISYKKYYKLQIQKIIFYNKYIIKFNKI